MASKVPSDPNLTPEMRRFLDNTATAEDRLTTYIDDQIDANALMLASQAEAEAGTDNAKYMSPLRVAQAIDAQAPVPIFTKSYTSAVQTVSAGGGLTLAHGLGTMPLLIQCRLKAINAVLGYSVGDELMLATQMGDNANVGISVVPDATNISVRFGSAATSIAILRKDTGAIALITNTDWNLIVLAWA